MCIRDEIEKREFDILSPLAVKANLTKGRKKPQEKCDYRTEFQRDRDRILHSKSFRRLMHKTQVFLNPEGDHYTTRLTHTLEVSQIARTAARALQLNEDLTEAIALGHDLGHTPFGHAGERALNEVCPNGFRHFEQSVRVVERLEKNGEGLNLTREVVDGIYCHTNGNAETLEGKLVRFCDKIAYLNHDADDAIRAGVLRQDDLPFEVRATLGWTKSGRITSLLDSLINNSHTSIGFSKETWKLFNEFRSFMFGTVYVDPIVKGEENKAEEIVKTLYNYFVKNPSKLPKEFDHIIETEGVDRAVCDYISGMTDRYVVWIFGDIFMPKSWKINIYD